MVIPTYEPTLTHINANHSTWVPTHVKFIIYGYVLMQGANDMDENSLWLKQIV